MEALVMESEMSNWNDDRLDELNRRMDEGFIRVDEGFVRVDERFVRLEGEMKEGFAKVDKRFERVEREMKEGFAQMASGDELTELKLASREETGEVKAQLDRLNDRIDRLHYSLVAGMVALFAALLANGVLS